MTSDSTDQDLEKIISEILERRESGESLSDADVIAAHPEYAEQLRVKLKQLQRIDEARQAADQETIDETVISGSETELNFAADQVPLAGQQIRHYVLVEQIGAGGFGTVWRAWDSKLECDVAVKIPRKEKLKPGDIERFIREARVSAQLRNHPNIVSVHEADWEDEIAFIASDFIEGISLSERMEQSPIPYNEATDLVITICGALHHAHEAGIVHRDLKPDNILLDQSGIPHVTDFGLAKQESQLVATDVGQIMGTAAYMSPEQAKGTSERADRRSDVFSLGVILFELLTRERPFRGSVPRILRQIIDVDPPRPRSFDPKIPVDLETICLKCLEKDPVLRYQTIAELGEDLKRYRKHEPILASPISTAGKLWRWCKRNPRIPWLSLTLILVTFAAMITAGILLNRGVTNMQEQTIAKMEEMFEFVALQARKEAELTLDEGTEAVQALVDNQHLAEALIDWNQINWDLVADTKKDRIEKLHAAAVANPELENDAFPDGLREVQLALKKVFESTDSDLEIFSSFVCDKDGYQIARVKTKDTLGERFDYRSYFTGGNGYPEGTPRSEISKIDHKRDSWNEPRLSEVFVTKTGDACVIAISAPVWDQAGIFQGVVGIFVELGKLIKVSSSDRDQKKVIMTIYDVRRGAGSTLEQAFLIHHPNLSEELQEKLADKHEELEKPIDQLLRRANLKSEGNQGKDGQFVRLKNYHDPFYDPDQNEKWLAVRNNEPIYEDLYVVIQIPESAIRDPGRLLLTNLVVLGLTLVGFAAAILIPMWIIIIRRVVVKE